MYKIITQDTFVIAPLSMYRDVYKNISLLVNMMRIFNTLTNIHVQTSLSVIHMRTHKYLNSVFISVLRVSVGLRLCLCMYICEYIYREEAICFVIVCVVCWSIRLPLFGDGIEKEAIHAIERQTDEQVDDIFAHFLTNIELVPNPSNCTPLWTVIRIK